MVICILGIGGCRSRPEETSEEALQRIEQTFVAGALADADAQAEARYLRVADSPVWEPAFRVERGKILLYEGESLKASEVLRGPISPDAPVNIRVRRLVYLAIAESRLGHFDVARSELIEAQEDKPEGVTSAEVWSGWGSFDLGQGRLEDAEKLFLRSLTEARNSGSNFLFMQSLMNLGVVALQQEHYEDATGRFEAAAAIARRLGAKLALEKATGNLGFVYFKLGDFERSLSNSSEAEHQAEKLGAIIDQVHLLNNAGLCEYKLDKLTEAENYYKQSLRLAQSIQNQEEMLDANVNLGFLALHSADKAGARTYTLEANRLAFESRNATLSAEPKILRALLVDEDGDHARAIHELLEVEHQPTTPPSMQWQAENSLGTIVANQRGQSGQAEYWFQKSLQTFRRQRASLSSVDFALPFVTNGDSLYQSYVQFLIHSHRTVDALTLLDEGRGETLAEGLQQGPTIERKSTGKKLTPKNLAERLHEVILVYSLQPGASFLWVITSTTVQFHNIAGRETILPLLRQHTKSIMTSRDLLQEVGSPANLLYEHLVKPAENLIAKGSRVYIVSADELSGLNFETLIPDGTTPHYWIEDVTITNGTSLHLLDRSLARPKKITSDELLLIGDPVYDSNFSPLANAAAETQKVANHFSRKHSTVLTQKDAAPANYARAKVENFEYLHFVAHATASMENPLDSAVILSAGPSKDDSYKLYAREILTHKLNARLVTLSSCYGSGVKNYSGEGLVGLAWAFLRAGARSVIGAMWEVSDASTPELMDRMYTELQHGSRTDDSLRVAKLALIHSSGVFRKPLYWAAFQLYAG